MISGKQSARPACCSSAPSEPAPSALAASVPTQPPSWALDREGELAIACRRVCIALELRRHWNTDQKEIWIPTYYRVNDVDHLVLA